MGRSLKLEYTQVVTNLTLTSRYSNENYSKINVKNCQILNAID